MWRLRHARRPPRPGSRPRPSGTRPGTAPNGSRRGSVQRRVVRIGGHHRQLVALAAQDRAPQLLRGRRGDVAGLGLDDVPGALRPARPPAGPGPSPRNRRRSAGLPRAAASSSGGASRSTRPIAPCTLRQPSGAPSTAPPPGMTATPRAESSETGPPWKTTPGSPASVGPGLQDVADAHRRGPVEDHAEGALLVVVEEQHHRAVEVRVREGGRRDEQPPCERGHLGHARHDPASSARRGESMPGPGREQVQGVRQQHRRATSAPDGRSRRARIVGDSMKADVRSVL